MSFDFSFIRVGGSIALPGRLNMTSVILKNVLMIK